MTLRFTPRAVQDLEAIAGFLRERNPQAVQRVRSSILGALRSIAEFPGIGRIQSVEGVRKLALRDNP